MSWMILITIVNIQDVDLNLLRVFDAVLRERAVTAAAARLGLTQPAVSNALARLRAVFGDALFVRTPAGMEPTPFARGVAEPVRQALALLESALSHGPGFDPASSTRAFRFYMSDLGQIEFLPPLVERAQRIAPAVQLEAGGGGGAGGCRVGWGGWGRRPGRGGAWRGVCLPAGARPRGAAQGAVPRSLC